MGTLWNYFVAGAKVLSSWTITNGITLLTVVAGRSVEYFRKIDPYLFVVAALYSEIHRDMGLKPNSVFWRALKYLMDSGKFI